MAARENDLGRRGLGRRLPVVLPRPEAAGYGNRRGRRRRCRGALAAVPARPDDPARRQGSQALHARQVRQRGAHSTRPMQRLEALGEAVGIDFAFDAIKVSPNTLDAHRVIRWAGTAGEAVQNRLTRRLFKLYFEEGANIGDHAVLIAAARESGMDAAVVETLACRPMPTPTPCAARSRPPSAWASPACPASCSKANMR